MLKRAKFAERPSKLSLHGRKSKNGGTPKARRRFGNVFVRARFTAR
jgi:hypothetical protein